MSQPKSLEWRIERLEQQNWWLKRIALVIAVGVVSVVFVGASQRQENEIKVNSLVITAPDGKCAIRLHAPKGNAELDIWDTTATTTTPQISIGCIPKERGGGTQVFMHGTKGQKAVNIVAQEKGNIHTW